MARPKIIHETKRKIPESEPPNPISIRRHEWSWREESSFLDPRTKSHDLFDVYLSSSADGKIRKHAEQNSASRLEVLGFLLGEVRTWKGVTYTVIRDAATTDLRSSASNVRFAPEAYPKLFHQLDRSGFDYVIVGWYHSHPGHTCFMSKTDVETQLASFREPYHVALVIDPVNREVKTFRLSGNRVVETNLAVYDPAAGEEEPRRRRKLKVKPVVAH